MEITRKRFDAKIERDLLVFSIMKDDYLKQIIPLMTDITLLSEPWTRTLFRWCSDYYAKFEKAPKAYIQEIYMERRLEDTESADMIGTLLSSLDADYVDDPHFNTKFHIERAQHFLNLQALIKLREKLNTAIDQRMPEQGIGALTEFKQVKQQERLYTDVTRDHTTMANAFKTQDQTLFTFPGAVGKLIGPINRGSFSAWVAKMKAGKSWWMLETAKQAYYAGCKVLFVNMEVEANSCHRRVMQSFQMRPKTDMEVRIPYFYLDEDGEDPTKWGIEYNEIHRQGVKSSEEDIAKFWKDSKQYHRGGEFIIEHMPAYVTSFKEIQDRVSALQYFHGFEFDVVIIDYLALCKLPPTTAKWEALGTLYGQARGWALRDNFALVTAAQANRGSTGKNSVGDGDIGGSFEILAHITTGITINASQAEKEAGMVRLGQLVQRDDEAFVDEVCVLNCYRIGCAHLDSRFMNDIIGMKLDNSKEEDNADN